MANEEYDPARDIWLACSPMPSPRHHIAVEAVDGRILAAGGRLSSFARNLRVTEE